MQYICIYIHPNSFLYFLQIYYHLLINQFLDLFVFYLIIYRLQLMLSGCRVNHWNMVNLLGVTSLKKTDLPLTEVNCLLFSQGQGFMNTFLFCARILAGLILYSSTAHSLSCCEFISAPVLSSPKETISLCSSSATGSYNLPIPLPMMVSEPQKGDVEQISHL